MQELAKIHEHEELRKDIKSGAILLSDKNVANEYRSKKAMLHSVRNVSDEINTIKQKLSKVDNLEKDMQEIKELLKGLVK